MKVRRVALAALLIGLGTGLGGFPAWAGEAVVRAVNVSTDGNGGYRFDVTIEHADTGWDHYADAFEIVAPDGQILGTRILLHPHVDEQPFTRALSGVRVPAPVKSVDVRARDTVHGLGAAFEGVRLPGR